MKMDENMVNKTVDEIVSSVLFLCENELSTLELNSKLDSLNEKMNTLQVLVVYSSDEKFIKTVSAMQLVANNLNNEISKKLGGNLSNEFREKQLDFLRNISTSFDIELKDTDNISSISDNKSKIEKEYKNKVSETKKDYKKENVKETVDSIIKSTNKKLNNYFKSPDDMKEYLKYMSKFYKYSIGNSSLIETQFRGATAVGSFKFWKDNGYSINKGEKGIQILTPATFKKFIDEEGNEKLLSKATKEEKVKLKNGQLKESSSGITYKRGYVFDISQTNATATDLPKLFPNKWLEGSVKDYILYFMYL